MDSPLVSADFSLLVFILASVCLTACLAAILALRPNA